MLTRGDVLDLRPVVDARATVVRGASGAGDEALVMEWDIGPHVFGPPPHAHPNVKETFRVLSGVLDVRVGGAWRTLRRGESVVIPAGTSHTVRNPTGRTIRVANVHAPGWEMGVFFADLHRVLHRGRGTSPLAPGRLLRLALLWRVHRHEIASTLVPDVVITLAAAAARALRLST